MREINLGLIIALIKKLTTKASTIGIKSISNGANNSITFTLSNGDKYTVQLNNIMVKSLYDKSRAAQSHKNDG